MSEALKYGVRPKVIAKYLGQLLLFLAVLTTVPAAVAFYYSLYETAACYGAVILLSVSFGIAGNLFRPAVKIQINEALVLTVAIFFLASLLMSIPLMSSGLSFIDAFFEAISGTTTTGLSVIDDIDSVSNVIKFSRAWMQWYGGLGIVVFSIAILLPAGQIAKILAAPIKEADDLVGGTKVHAKRILSVYLILTAIGILALVILGIDFFTSTLYILASVSTGGFSPNAASLAALPTAAQICTTLIAFVGACPIIFFHQLTTEGLRWTFESMQIAALVLLILLLATLLFLFSENALTPLDSLLSAASSQTTTGFSVRAISAIPDASKLIICFSMFIGGGIGSTAGGIKILRFLLFIKILIWLVKKTAMPPHALSTPKWLGKSIEESGARQSLMIIGLFFCTINFSWFLFVLYGYPPLDALFEVISATGTVGLSTGITGAELPTFLKGVLSVDMFLGRLEIFAWIVLLAPTTWLSSKLEEK